MQAFGLTVTYETHSVWSSIFFSFRTGSRHLELTSRKLFRNLLIISTICTLQFLEIAMKEYLLVFITAPAGKAAEEIAETLVQERLAACVNIIYGIRSIYSWKGKIERDSEDLLVVKTRAEMLEQLTQKVVDLHPYDVPEVIAHSLEAGYSPYLQWIDDVLASDE
jgi:periplasmic divalent cation tolerance protein